MFHGTISAIVTPFQEVSATKGGGGAWPEIDFKALESLVEWQIASGVDGIVACGSTGEAATLSDEEKLSVIRRVKEIVAGRVPVIAGTGNNSTRHSLELTKAARELGVEGALLVAPYYNKPTQEGLYQHFSLVAKEGGLPCVVYNIPGRSVVEIQPETFRRLTKVPGIVAVKHAVDSITRLVEVAEALDGKVALLAGDDPIIHAVYSVGGSGVISASASVFPKRIKKITEAGKKGDLTACFKAQSQALPYIHALFLETNPIPAKAVLQLLGHLPSAAVRLPLVPVSPVTLDKLKTIFQGFADE